MPNWTQPLCTACWLEREGTWEGDKLLGYQIPVAIRGSFEERLSQCCECGRATTSGIFIRVDPSTVAYPRADAS